MIIATTKEIQGRNITQTLGAVYGVSVQSRSDLGTFLGKIRAIGGGKMGGYEKLVKTAREQAVAAMQQEAQKVGADAVICFRFDSSSMGAGDAEDFMEVTAYGTAVKLEAMKG
ncbi:YbjQ family protein [Acidithiobacillus thiooxidans]|uniref:UPF0145 protein DLNHIDIE_01893 n=1 Tax=Acidithiobacillus thiooxidans ATCC 19377 TaxID=637390 RepID=A0A543Q6S2_ACITH|nr:YbjQ family protein [Acidithiobacillus thiooxidans]MDX5933771.1 YbjQ family protein [Acidithiobacillus thiooxidans]TQN52012.1 hypothetical protein DLNHIDIE_01893 [Acidithiobacillus thiooxidans ATCC 19377]